MRGREEILARRRPAAPEDFVALQVSRLNEALLVAYGAMSAENLRAVGLVVKIVRELDRYHGFAAAGRRAGRDPRPVEAEAREPLAGDRRATASQEPERICRRSPDVAAEREPAFVVAPAQDVESPVAPPGDRPEMAPQEPEKMEFAPEKGAGPGRSGRSGLAASKPVGAAGSWKTPGPWTGMTPAQNRRTNPSRPPPPPRHGLPRRRTLGRATARKWRRKSSEIIESAPGDCASPVSAEANDGASPNEDAIASSRDASPLARQRRAASNFRRKPFEKPEPAAATWTELGFDSLGNVRRMKVRALLNGVAACAD